MHHLSLNIDHIIKGCQQYQPAMQEAMYKHCYPAMMGVCMRYVDNRDDAAVIYNEALLKVLQNIEQYQCKGEFMGWVRRIVVNTCIDNCRKKVKYQIVELTDNIDNNNTVDNGMEQIISSEEVVIWLQQLAPNTALVFNMYCLEGYTIDEIATKLNITTGTTKWHISEARKKLKEKMRFVTTQKMTNAQ
jgi:RNA polymerase sigma-70 factor, ECF subfamily